MEIIYNNKSIKNGEFFEVMKAKRRPRLFINMNPYKYYTLIFHDTNAIGGNKIHWILINITDNDVKNGTEIISYNGPNPPINTGIHHYKFELYEQPKYNDDLCKINERFFTMNKILKKLKLKNYNLKFHTQFKIQTNEKVKTPYLLRLIYEYFS